MTLVTWLPKLYGYHYYIMVMNHSYLSGQDRADGYLNLRQR